jgi:hypothetical protein
VSTKQFFVAFEEGIEQALQPLFEFIANPENIEFEEDICQTVTTLISVSKRVSTTNQIVYPHIFKVFTKYKMELGNLFQMLNMYINFGSHWLLQSPENISMLLEIITATIQKRSKSSDYDLSTTSQGVLLAHLIFLYFPRDSLDEELKVLISALFDRLS